MLSHLRTTARTLWREPAYSGIAILTLAIGIGGNTSIFSIVNGVLLRPLDYREPDRLVSMREVVPPVAHTYPTLPVSARHFMEWTERTKTFESLSLMAGGTANLTGEAEPERLRVVSISPNFFDTLGVKPAIGRTFVQREDVKGRHLVAVLTHSFWRRRFQADPDILGRKILLDSEPHTVIGVLPAEFRYPALDQWRGSSEAPEVYKPKVYTDNERRNILGMHNYAAIGSLKAGISREQAEAELNVIARQIVELAGEKTELRAEVKRLNESIVGRARRGLLVLWAAVGVVLLIGCANLANLALARSERKAREVAVRTALGAGRWQLIRHALTESGLIALLGGTLGVTVAAASLGALVRFAPPEIPRLDSVQLDVPVLLFALAATIATGVLFGLGPAWRAASTDPQNALRTGTRSSSDGGKIRRSLVAAEVGLGTVLLVTAALLLTSWARLIQSEKGFHAPSVLAVNVAVPYAKFNKDEQRNAFHERVLSKLAEQPGIVSAAISTALPLEGETWVDDAYVPGEARPKGQRGSYNIRFISADYFRTMGIPLLAGRTFNEADRGQKRAVVSERTARALWGDNSPLGRKFARNENELYEVIGVAGDVRADTDKAPVAMIYRQYQEWAPGRVVLVARGSGDPRSIAGGMREAIRFADPEVPIPAMRTMQEILEGSVATRRFQMLLASSFAGVALLMAALGIYGVVSYTVARRTNEMGIRMALGARSSDVQSMVVRQALVPVALGLTGGVAASLVAGRILTSLLFEVSSRDPLILGSVTGALLAIALIACYVPARRATRIDPMLALRCD